MTAAVVALKKVSDRQKEKDQKTIAQEIAEEYEKAAGKITDLKENMSELKDSFNSRASDIDSETERTKNLWKELDNLADSSGKVQDKDKIRAEYILGELNEALGTEYTMTGNQIDNYRIMKQEIDDLIEKKKAMSYIDSYSEQSAEYAKQRAEAYAGYTSSRASYNEYNRQMQLLADEFTRLTGEKGDYTTLNTQIDSWEQNNIPVSEKGGDLYNALMSLQSEYNTALANRAENAQLMGEYKKVYNEASEYLNKLEDAERALAEGRYKDVEDYLYAVKDNNREILKDENKTNEERQKAFGRSLDECLAGLSLSLQSGRKEAVASALETMGEIVKEGKAGGGELSEGFMVEFRDYAQKVLDKGFDISELAKWGKDIGIDIGDVFQDDFKDIVQRQIDKGFDIKDLIVWGTNSGLTIGDNYDKEFEKLVQKALDEMYPDTSGLVQWAIDNGTALGEIFGENYSQHLSEYMREVELAYWKRWDEVGVQSINSASDAAKYYAGDYGIGSKSNLRYFAKGGFLGSGQGIVAEAGPELIEIMNGGARITPLTGNARNTVVSGSNVAGGQKNFYSSYTINATIAGKYDVTRLAEDLEMERRRIEAGRGL